jgi:hypothetical protein
MNLSRSFARLAASALLLVSASSLRADEVSDNLAAHLNGSSLDALAKDLGALVGVSSFHHGKALGFPLGFDLGGHGARVGIANDDKVLRDNGSTAQALSAQGEYGLPGGVNLLGRYGKTNGTEFYGGGLRYGLYSGHVPAIPSVSIAGLYDKVRHAMLDATVYTANIVASFDVPFIHPYLGVGYDATELRVKDNVAAASGTTVETRDGGAHGYRFEAGINISLIPFTYLSAGGGWANGHQLAHLGLGARF